MGRFGKYEVVEKIGEGGFGVVYEGFDPGIRRRVAIKTCTARDPDARDRFQREAEIAGNLQHRNVTILYDAGEENGVPYLVQELLTGEDLDRKIEREDPLSFATKLLYLIEIARGLEHAHSRGIVHRDVKPANVRILEDGMVKILDFGIARHDSDPDPSIAHGETVGTAAYLAPEQIRGLAVDHRCDIHAFGALSYELLSGRRAFPGNDPTEVMRGVLETMPPPLHEAWPSCPPALEALVFRCLSKDPELRYQSLGEVVGELESLNRSPAGDGSGDEDDADDAPWPPGERGSDWNGAALAAPATGTPRSRDRHRAQSATPRLSPGLWAALLALAAILVVVAAARLGPWRERTGPESGGAGNASERSSPSATAAIGSTTAVGSALSSRSDQPASSRATPDAATDADSATLVVAPGWSPDIRLSVSNQPAVRIDEERRFRLEPDVDHYLELSLVDGDFRITVPDRIRLRPGEERRISAAVPWPAALSVENADRASRVFVRLDGRALGWTPIEGRSLAPGSYRLEVWPSSSSQGTPLQVEALDLRSNFLTRVLFDTRALEPATIVEERWQPEERR